MKEKKTPFFIKIKNAIFSFDEYSNFSEEKVSLAIKYLLKIVLLFSLIIAIALTIRVINISNELISQFKNECPEFSFKNYVLSIEGDNKKIVKGDDNGYFGIVVDNQSSNLNDVEESKNYQRVVGILKDKVVIKNSDGKEESATYKQLNERYNLSEVNKETLVNYLSGSNLTKIYAVFAVIVVIYIFIAYLIQFLLDIFLLSIVGYLFSRMIKLKLQYKSIFNISIYALTLSILLYAVYDIVNIYTGFTIRYFEVAYNAIAYIYVVTAILMIKSDLVKQQIEVGRIIKEQKKIREENKEKKDQDKDKDKDKEKREKKKEEKEENKPDGKEEPEGNEA